MVRKIMELTTEQLATRIAVMDLLPAGVHLEIIQDLLAKQGISASLDEIRDALFILQQQGQGHEAQPLVERPAGAVRLGHDGEPGVVPD